MTPVTQWTTRCHCHIWVVQLAYRPHLHRLVQLDGLGCSVHNVVISSRAQIHLTLASPRYVEEVSSLVHLVCRDSSWHLAAPRSQPVDRHRHIHHHVLLLLLLLLILLCCRLMLLLKQELLLQVLSGLKHSLLFELLLLLG